ncbi:MAG: bifunctional riboflavin kinase/FAD synthetase [Pseudomonadota bacterium]
MRIISDIPADLRSAAAAIGNFDGVHLGHQAIINQAEQQAQALGAPLGIVTFEPHPRAFFAPEAEAFRLMDAAARASRLEKLGVEVLYEIPFTQELANLSSQSFVEDVLKDGLGLAHAVVGQDFRFGQKRAGDASQLQKLCHANDIGATVAPLIALGPDEVSSTAIRAALSAGNPKHAAEMLGHWHRIEGEILHGDKRGRELGYPTANMSLKGRHLPKFGVYAVKIDVLDGPHQGTYQGASSIGVRPMFGENSPNCETYIFDFEGNLYGSQVSVALVDYLRGEEKFDWLPALITQMDADCARAREILADVG